MTGVVRCGRNDGTGAGRGDRSAALAMTGVWCVAMTSVEVAYILRGVRTVDSLRMTDAAVVLS